jgi:hypothetical protein
MMINIGRDGKHIKGLFTIIIIIGERTQKPSSHVKKKHRPNLLRHDKTDKLILHFCNGVSSYPLSIHLQMYIVIRKMLSTRQFLQKDNAIF